jgi:hypothetical protein
MSIPKQRFPVGHFDADRHPRGYHGRFAGSLGSGSNAHAMRVKRAAPDPGKRMHAVVPHIRNRTSVTTYGTGGTSTGID